jgi:hypothetical protein
VAEKEQGTLFFTDAFFHYHRREYMRCFSLLILVLYGGVVAEGTVTAAQLLAALKGTAITGKVFKTDEGGNPLVTINKIEDVVYWTADMDIDCDGRRTNECNENTDPWYQDKISTGEDIAASETPYFVIPVPSSDFNKSDHGIQFGQVAAVVYNNKVAYGPFLDECGDAHVIGEASYAMAKILGINPDPQNGGTDGPVTYIVFTGSTGKVKNNADHAEAVTVGNARAQKLVGTNILFGDNTANASDKNFRMLSSVITVYASAHHTLTVLNYKGQNVISRKGSGSQKYNLSGLKQGLYLITVKTASASQTERFLLF